MEGGDGMDMASRWSEVVSSIFIQFFLTAQNLMTLSIKNGRHAFLIRLDLMFFMSKY